MDEKVAAMEVLKALGSNASVATPALLGFLGNWHYASEACETLASIGPQAAAAIPRLKDLLATNYVMVTNNVRGFGGRPRAVRQELVPRWRVARALASIDPHDETAIAILREAESAKRSFFVGRALQSTADLGQSLPARFCLWKIGMEIISPNELMALAQNDVGQVTALLGEIGPPAKKGLPSLEKHLKQIDYYPGKAANAMAILKIDPEEANRVGLPGLFIICPDKY